MHVMSGNECGNGNSGLPKAKDRGHVYTKYVRIGVVNGAYCSIVVTRYICRTKTLTCNTYLAMEGVLVDEVELGQVLLNDRLVCLAVLKVCCVRSEGADLLLDFALHYCDAIDHL